MKDIYLLYRMLRIIKVLLTILKGMDRNCSFFISSATQLITKEIGKMVCLTDLEESSMMMDHFIRDASTGE